MALNGSGIRDTARVVRVSPTTVINTLKKKRQAYSKSMKDFSNVLMLSRCRSSSTRWEAAEVDEMWSFVGSKSQQR